MIFTQKYAKLISALRGIEFVENKYFLFSLHLNYIYINGGEYFQMFSLVSFSKFI